MDFNCVKAQNQVFFIFNFVICKKGQIVPIRKGKQSNFRKEKKNPKDIVGKEKPTWTVVIVMVFKCQNFRKTNIMILSWVKKIQCNELLFLFCVELPTQYSPEVGKTKAKTFYTKVKNSTNEFLWKQI